MITHWIERNPLNGNHVGYIASLDVLIKELDRLRGEYNIEVNRGDGSAPRMNPNQQLINETGQLRIKPGNRPLLIGKPTPILLLKDKK